MELPNRRRSAKALSIWGAIWIAFPIVIGLTQGKSQAEKILTDMATPLFLVWSLLVVASILSFCAAKKIQGWLLLLVCISLWCVSTQVVVDRLVQHMESSIPSWDYVKDEPLDAIVVFGGGTSRDLHGRSQFGQSGDRAGWGARLYHLGKTKKLIATGTALPGVEAISSDPSIQAREIWLQLKVPDDAIEEIDGINTFHELQNIAKHPDVIAGKRVGFLTSAFHLPRVMRLAKAAGVEGIPIASDFRSNSRVVKWQDLIPDADALNRFDLIFKEFLAGFLGR